MFEGGNALFPSLFLVLKILMNLINNMLNK